MNVKEINPGTNETLMHYAATAVPFTLVTVWVIIAFQSKYLFEENASPWKRLGWPYMLLRHWRDKLNQPIQGPMPMHGAHSDVLLHFFDVMFLKVRHDKGDHPVLLVSCLPHS